MSDADLQAELTRRMLPRIDVPGAIFRGAYQAVVAGMHRRGIPLDMERVRQWTAHWSEIQDRLIDRVEREAQTGIFTGGTWSHEGLHAFVTRWEASTGQRWPRSGKAQVPLTTGDVLDDLAALDPALAPVKAMFSVRRQARGLEKLAIGGDGRNRFWIDAIKQKTGRDSMYADGIPGYPKFMRGLILAPHRRAVLIFDYKNQEPSIAAAQSRDPELMAICSADDPYIALARKFRLVPATATKDSHPAERKTCKTVLLGLNYGMQARRLALTLRCPERHAYRLMQLHKELFHVFWRWSWCMQDAAVRRRTISTKLGFSLRLTPAMKPTTLMDWPMQAGGAELTRLACIFAAARGVEILASHHDSLMVECDDSTIEDVAAVTEQAMVDAGHELFDFPFRVERTTVRHPDRYLPEDGRAMWDRVEAIVAELAGHPRHFPTATGSPEGSDGATE
jgi:DNA polymerase family A